MTDLDKEFVKAGRIRLTDHSVSAKVTVQTVTKKITNKYEWKAAKAWNPISSRKEKGQNRKDECNGSDRHHERNFEEQVLRAEKPVLVDFWAPWCTYCRRIAPAVDQVAGQYGEQMVVGKVNVDEQPELAERFGVETIPTLMLFQKGKGTRSDYRSPVQRPGNGMAEGKRCGIKRPMLKKERSLP